MATKAWDKTQFYMYIHAFKFLSLLWYVSSRATCIIVGLILMAESSKLLEKTNNSLSTIWNNSQCKKTTRFSSSNFIFNVTHIHMYMYT